MLVVGFVAWLCGSLMIAALSSMKEPLPILMNPLVALRLAYGPM